MADISPMSVIDAPEFDYTSVKRKVLAGEDFPARKLQRGPNSRFLPQLASLQNLSKIINHVKYDASISRVSIKHSLKSQLYAAMGQIPRQKSEQGKTDVGMSIGEFLVLMLERVRMEDGSQFKVDNSIDSNFSILQVECMTLTLHTTVILFFIWSLPCDFSYTGY